MWPLIIGGLGVGGAAMAARTALRAAQRSGIKVEMPNMPSMSMPGFSALRRDKNMGFEPEMTRKEAQQILNLNQMNPHKDVIREAHRRLLVANHPDKGGSTYVASKINEAKDVLLGKRKM
mmetsp:Transcript_61301/g.145967  ORF Transcript_61301/g.145967 Transcript_61301/m.145967 type:complete len:120 (+) Transcript_61301:78-437(+)